MTPVRFNRPRPYLRYQGQWTFDQTVPVPPPVLPGSPNCRVTNPSTAVQPHVLLVHRGEPSRDQISLGPEKTGYCFLTTKEISLVVYQYPRLESSH
jgi:hypothetical protein